MRDKGDWSLQWRTRSLTAVKYQICRRLGWGLSHNRDGFLIIQKSFINFYSTRFAMKREVICQRWPSHTKILYMVCYLAKYRCELFGAWHEYSWVDSSASFCCYHIGGDMTSHKRRSYQQILRIIVLLLHRELWTLYNSHLQGLMVWTTIYAPTWKNTSRVQHARKIPDAVRHPKAIL